VSLLEWSAQVAVVVREAQMLERQAWVLRPAMIVGFLVVMISSAMVRIWQLQVENISRL
jgi:hypothetical protein